MDAASLKSAEDDGSSRLIAAYPPVSLDDDICEQIFQTIPFPTENLFREKVNQILRSALKL